LLAIAARADAALVSGRMPFGGLRMIGFRIGRALLCSAFVAGVVTTGGAVAAACLAKRLLEARREPEREPRLSPG
jgi:hypothetical protein